MPLLNRPAAMPEPQKTDPEANQPRRVLVSDFDGTITRRDFYLEFVQRLMPADAPDFWAEFEAGRMTHFDALASIFGYVPAGEDTLHELIATMEIEPQLAEAVDLLRRNNWHIVVVSAGCRWYIDQLLEAAGVSLEVHSNPGSLSDDGRLQMTRATDAPYYSYEIGVDKAGVVRAHLEAGSVVAFAGDGMPDLPAALLVPEALRFARGDLAALLEERNESYRPFARWLEVAEALKAEFSEASESAAS